MLFRHVGKASIGIASLCTALFLPKAAHAHGWTGSCTVNFDNLFALTWVYANARNTFAVRTGLTNGSPATCSASHASCWTYRHRCGTNYVNVDDDAGSHFHLSFTDPGFNAGHHGSTSCGFHDPGDGFGAGMRKLSGGTCVTPDWKREPRSLNSHTGANWTKIYVGTSSTGAPKIFDMPRISVGGSTAIQLWFKKQATQQWFFWSSIAPGNWNLSPDAHDIDQVMIKAASSDITYQINDFDILD